MPAAPPGEKPEGEGESGPVDEVGFDLGLDEAGRGLLDTWAGRTLPGEPGVLEPTGSFAVDDLPLTAILARVAAGLGRQAAVDRFAAAEGQPSRAVKALIADEPLDPLPVPEGLPLYGVGFLDAGAGTEITAVARRPTAAAPSVAVPLTDAALVDAALAAAPPAAAPVDAPPPRAEPEIGAGLLALAVLLALVAGAAGAWLVLGGL